MDWQHYWNTVPATLDERDFLRQVGKTVEGHPIDDSVLAAATSSVARSLSIDSTDRLLDLCCGNGLLTATLAPMAREVVAVDFSMPLIEIATRHHARPNIEYVLGSIFDLPGLGVDPGAFDKILIHEALQHFDHADLSRIVDALTFAARPSVVVLIASIPDRNRVWHFYDTPSRRAERARRLAAGNEAIGTWWDPVELSHGFARAGFDVEILDQPDVLHTAHYRFDLRLVRRDT